MDNSQIVEELRRLDKQCDAIKDEIIRLIWWMRGSINFNDAMFLSPKDKEIIVALIKENMETSKKTGTPIF
jgi:uncharacterized protein Yka (UPF0111/DUF47 family)